MNNLFYPHPIFDDIARLGAPVSGRLNLSTPWVHGGYLYASNGVIIARVPTVVFAPSAAVIVGSTPEQRPAVGHLFDYTATEWGPRISIDHPGQGPRAEVCECVCAESAGCDDCGGTGVSINPIRRILVGAVALNWLYLDMLWRYWATGFITAGVRTGAAKGISKPTPALRFEIPWLKYTIEGLLMGMRQEPTHAG